MNYSSEFNVFLGSAKKIFIIPDYQREFKWEKAKVKTFVDNIMQRSKFLGILTTEVDEAIYLSIVDGQQRLTTIMLMLAQLYNACAEDGETETQSEIKGLLTCEIEGHLRFRLENGSVGDYLVFFTDENGHDKIKLEINATTDIYKQSKKFSEAWKAVSTELSAIREKNSNVTLDLYKQRLVDCKVLLFAQKNTDNQQQGSSEEIYIDINEKAQKLDAEDIFKGHCFAICKTEQQQNRVKELWRSIKQQFFLMDSIFKNADMGVFLHFYFACPRGIKSTHDRKDIKKDLTIGGENVITHHYNTPTRAINLLQAMKHYQSSITTFASNLNTLNHTFPQIMNNTPQIIGNYRDQLKEQNTILRDIVSCNQNLFKLPLFFLIDDIIDKTPQEKLTYKQLAGFVYLYYIYMFFFSRISVSTKREDLPKGLIYKIHLQQNYLLQFINDIINYSRGFTIDETAMCKNDTRKHLYNILDSFKATSVRSPATDDTNLDIKLRLFPDSYNVEHLLINQSHTINWRSVGYDEEHPITDTEYTFSDCDFSACNAWTAPNNCWANFIWIDKDYNRDVLKNKDIINKIKLLRGSLVKEDHPSSGSFAKKHSHIETICQHIMNMHGYDSLLEAYRNNASRTEVLDRYKDLINSYFAQENIDRLRDVFRSDLVGVLNNLEQFVR